MVKIETEKVESIKGVLEKAISAKKASLKADRDYREEKARLRLETDWGEHFDKKPTDKDKDAYVNFHSLPLKELADDLKAEADYHWEVWELQKIILRKEINHGG